MEIERLACLLNKQVQVEVGTIITVATQPSKLPKACQAALKASAVALREIVAEAENRSASEEVQRLEAQVTGHSLEIAALQEELKGLRQPQKGKATASQELREVLRKIA